MYCEECLCIETGTRMMSQDCQNKTLVADGFCNDETNILTCQFDGGDCCLDYIRSNCSNCLCHKDGIRHPEFVPTDPPTSVGFCYFPILTGNANCDVEANTFECNYDGGDCCLPVINFTYSKGYL